MFSNIYNNRRVLITGHTGFKGSWLTLWLTQLNAVVTGFALDPESTPNHWNLLQLHIADVRGDVRDSVAVQNAVQSASPEIVFHLAAQPLVRRSYHNPPETWSTNVLGTVNVLEACRNTESVKAVVVVTTDKCYENQEQIWGYRESDRLGGHDPYSASKAAAEMVVTSYRKSFFSQDGSALLASARAGNVIGGGDWSADRLIPDGARAVAAGASLEIRSPNATRPWQHVLECLAGYLVLGQHLLQSQRPYADAWNFGPGSEGNQTVEAVLAEMQAHWPQLQWHQTAAPQPHETTLLQLDSTRAHQRLGWRPVWPLSKGLEATADWYRHYEEKRTAISDHQLALFISDAKQKQQPWAMI